MAKKTRAVAKRRSYTPSRRGSTDLNAILIIGLVVLVIYLLFRSKGTAGQYLNEEKWEIKWDPKTMLPLEVTVHRDARRQ